jgi:hypothetical protein
MQATIRASAMGWFHFNVTESAHGVHFTESAAGLGFGGTFVAGRALLKGLGHGWPRSVRLILFDRRFYVNAPGLPYAPSHKPWIAFGTDSLSKPAMAGWRQLVQGAGLLRDPRDRGSIFTVLGCSTGAGDARRVTLAGEPMALYEGLFILGPATSSDPTLKRLAVYGARSVRWALWLDRSGLPRRLVLSADTRAYGRMVMDEGFSGWGDTVWIKPPPPSMTATLPRSG